MSKKLFISGFYRSGVQMTSEGIAACGGIIDENYLAELAGKVTVGEDFLGWDPKSGVWGDVQEDEKEIEFVPCFGHVKDCMASSKSKPTVILIYRPLEQVVDSITRVGISRIYVENKGLKRMWKLRAYQKNLSALQLKIKNQFIEFYSSFIQQADQLNLISFDSSRFEEKFPDLIKNINLNSTLVLDNTKASDFFQNEKFTKQKRIEKYRESALNNIKSFFE